MACPGNAPVLNTAKSMYYHVSSHFEVNSVVQDLTIKTAAKNDQLPKPEQLQYLKIIKKQEFRQNHWYIPVEKNGLIRSGYV